MPDIAIHPKKSVTLCGFITDLHLASVTSKNCCQQEALPSVMKLSEIGVINSGKGIVVKIVSDKLRSFQQQRKSFYLVSNTPPSSTNMNGVRPLLARS